MAVLSTVACDIGAEFIAEALRGPRNSLPHETSACHWLKVIFWVAPRQWPESHREAEPPSPYRHDGVSRGERPSPVAERKNEATEGAIVWGAGEARAPNPALRVILDTVRESPASVRLQLLQ